MKTTVPRATADVAAAADPADPIVNGSFEVNGGVGTRIFAGWTVVDLPGSAVPGSWFVQRGTASPLNSFLVASPTDGLFAAMTDQNGPGAHLLYQDVTVPAGGATLSFDLYLNNHASGYFSPNTLSFVGVPNQQFRVDIMNPAAPVDDVGAGVLQTVYRTLPGHPLVLGYRTVTADLSAHAGRTVRLRFAEVDNQLFFNVGVDNVRLGAALPPATCFGLPATITTGTPGPGGVTTFTGTPGDDVIIGTAGPDVILGGGGDDRICGLGGIDRLFGGDGNDRIHGGTGDDRIEGQNGNDLIEGGDGNDHVEGNAGDDDVQGNTGDDIVAGGPGTDVNDGGVGNNDRCFDPQGGSFTRCESTTTAPPPPVPGADVVVFNDINPFDNMGMANPSNVTMVRNLVTYTHPGPRGAATVVWIDRGRNSPCATGECTPTGHPAFLSTIAAAGFTVTGISSASGTLVSIPASVKVIFLFNPTVAFTIAEINTLKAFAAEGGRVVFVGEHAGYYGAAGIAVENAFLRDMGTGMTNIGNFIDCGYNTLPGTSLRPHQITTGMTSVTMACSSEIALGASDFPLYYDSSNTRVLAGVAPVGSTPLLQTARVQPAPPSLKQSAPAGLNPNSSTGR
ncbi:MAG: hypothetical protein WKG32_03825 [Gemmatimonadaceae bacterium]